MAYTKFPMKNLSRLSIKKKTLLIVIIACLLPLIGLCLDLFLHVKGEGVVTNNNHGCYADGVCSLTVETDGTTREITYEIGWGVCQYSEADAGVIEVGDEVDFYAKAESYVRNSLSICENEDYYIIKKADQISQ